MGFFIESSWRTPRGSRASVRAKYGKDNALGTAPSVRYPTLTAALHGNAVCNGLDHNKHRKVKYLRRESLTGVVGSNLAKSVSTQRLLPARSGRSIASKLGEYAP